MAPVAAITDDQLAELAGAIAQIDGDSKQTPDLHQSMADDPIEQVDVDIAAADDQHHGLAFQLVLQFERARQRGGAGAFGEKLQALEHQQDSLADFEIVDGDGAFDATAHHLERNRTDAAGGETVGNRVDGTANRSGRVGGETRGQLRRAGSLDADHLGVGRAQRKRGRDSRDQSAAANRNDHDVGRNFVGDFEADGALPRDHVSDRRTRR